MNSVLSAAVLTLTLALTTAAQDPTVPDNEPAAKAAVDALKQATKDKDADARLAAISACGAAPHRLSAAALAPCLADPSDDIRIAAAGALGQMTGLEDAARALNSSLARNAERSKVFLSLLAAIVSVQHPSSVAACSEFVDDRLARRDASDQSEINLVLDTLSRLSFKATVDALIDILAKNEVVGHGGGNGTAARSENRTSRALRRLLGEDLYSSKEWKSWWGKHAKEFNNDLTRK
jgi:hypothetical protein